MGMRMGGRAANDGVTFYSENYKASFTMDKEGNYEISSRKLIQSKGIKERLGRIPIVRGFVVLFSDFLIALIILLGVAADLFGYGGMLVSFIDSDFREIILMIVSLVSLGCFVYVAKTTFYKVKNVWQFHGAEHKVVYGVVNELSLELEDVRKYPRMAKRCGTNLVMFWIVFWAVIRFLILGIPSLSIVFAFVLSYEIFDLENGDEIPIAKIFFKAGYWLQENAFTKEPTDAQLSAAICTAKKLIELEEVG